MLRSRSLDSRSLLWGLLGLWILVELLYSSRWFPPLRLSPISKLDEPTLRSLLSANPSKAVWMAPFVTFPEPSFVESSTRRGFYDTLLVFPSNIGLATNYGASKLGPADTLFSWASVHGLSAELRLARRLGYGLFAVDLGALADPHKGILLCKHYSRCRLSADAYALFPIAEDFGLDRGLVELQRRVPLLPWRGESNGLSWGPLVFNQFHWGPVAIPVAGKLDLSIPFELPARPSPELQIYRHPISAYPASVQPWLRLAPNDVQLTIPVEVRMLQLCIRPKNGICRVVRLGPERSRIAIGQWLQPGVLTQLHVQKLTWRKPGSAPLILELRLPRAAQAMSPPATPKKAPP